MGEDLGRERPARLLGHAALAQHLQYPGVVQRVHHRDHVLVVLTGGPEHGGPAHVDVLDGVLEGDVRIGDGGLKGIEIDRHQPERDDPVLRHDGAVLRQIGPAQEPPVDQGVEGLHPAVQDLGEAGDLVHIGDSHPGLPQRPRGAAGGDDLPAKLHQRPGELHDAPLVTHGNQRAFH